MENRNILDKVKHFFPITSLKGFIDLVEEQIIDNDLEEPNLVFLSILFGYLEHELTVNRISNDESLLTENDSIGQNVKNDEQHGQEEFPVLDLEIVEGLYKQIVLFIKANVDKSQTDFTTRSGFATKKLCKHVSDIMWNGLLRSYHKDKAHIQSLFSYLTRRQLDCFGLAFVVVAACQVLNYSDVHLMLSGDHAWAACGEDSKEMVEITWHGRDTEDKRGNTIDNFIMAKNWLYYSGSPVKCDRKMELAALLVSINPSLDVHTESEELQFIQFRLLHSMYRKGHLDKYPMALSSLADLLETATILIPSENALPDAEILHEKAVSSVRDFYNDLHVFPYCSQGHYFLRQSCYKKAIQCWAKAAQILAKYNYGKDDEELYKEVIEIANDSIIQALKGDPQLCSDKDCYYDIIRNEAANFHRPQSAERFYWDDRKVLKFRFYDGICLWEEDSSTPVLHSWWAKYFTLSVGKFQPEVRESFKDTSPGKSTKADVVKRRSSRMNRLGSPSVMSDDCDLDSNVSGVGSPVYSSRDEHDVASDVALHAHRPITKLHLCSQKMKDLKDVLTSGKKINSQAVSLLLTAQSQVHFVKRRSNVASEYNIEYNENKRVRKSRDYD